jgi:hypothetical protein
VLGEPAPGTPHLLLLLWLLLLLLAATGLLQLFMLQHSGSWRAWQTSGTTQQASTQVGFSRPGVVLIALLCTSPLVQLLLHCHAHVLAPQNPNTHWLTYFWNRSSAFTVLQLHLQSCISVMAGP